MILRTKMVSKRILICKNMYLMHMKNGRWSLINRESIWELKKNTKVI